MDRARRQGGLFHLGPLLFQIDFPPLKMNLLGIRYFGKIMRPSLLFFFCATLMVACTDPKKEFWQSYADGSLKSGKLRQDRSPEDAPFNPETLARNFQKIAFSFEDDPLGRGRDSERPENSLEILRRWEKDLAYRFVTPRENLTGPKSRVEEMLTRLAALTGQNVFPADQRTQRNDGSPAANLLIFLGDDAYFDLLETSYVRNSIIGTDKQRDTRRGILDFVKAWHKSRSPCAGSIYWTNRRDEGKFGHINGGVITIRTDLGPTMLSACVEEELSQIMGLPNDNKDVRPSIFNDDQEFGLLTEHDALMLRTLYDDRLRPGMSVDEAMPKVRQILNELFQQGNFLPPQDSRPDAPPKPTGAGSKPVASSALSG